MHVPAMHDPDALQLLRQSLGIGCSSLPAKGSAAGWPVGNLRAVERGLRGGAQDDRAAVVACQLIEYLRTRSKQWARQSLCFIENDDAIPRSSHNPKILWVDDAEIVGDRIAEVRPILGNFVTQKTERGIGELGAGRVAFVVRDVLVHEAPQPLDRTEMRAIGRDEMQLDPAAGPGEPFLHQLGVMIARVVKKD